MQVTSSSLTFNGFLAMLALCTSPVPRFKMLNDALWWFGGVFSGSIHVLADSVFLGKSGFDV